MQSCTRQHKFYCGIDLHARKMYVCILDVGGNTRVHQNIKTDPETFLHIITPFLENIMVYVEPFLQNLIQDHGLRFPFFILKTILLFFYVDKKKTPKNMVLVFFVKPHF